ncbi:ATP-NAD kinase family protein [Colwellia sp. UCD-KL20]|uniref:ATP-NAD kinase family protein n=1 Tax=Colwellia sp. UCD-KL20 TaxID=1917165 RepID=UPI000970AD2E|nr:ATP-NAD kinase family protein [Colwellia sp. UCD-KL20]
MKKFKLGFVINPVAGVGGSVALKGSDGESTPEKALSLGAQFEANQRANTALSVLEPYKDQIIIYTASGSMGEMCATELGFEVAVVYSSAEVTHSAEITSEKFLSTSAQDTKNFVNALLNAQTEAQVDVLLFAGGDGTARDICATVNDKFPVLGIPAGCKIHSGVYAVTPKAAGRVVEMLVTNQLVTLMDADVMDIDESLFRQGVVKAKRYGEMQIPSELRYVQAVKSGGKETDELVLQDIAAHIIETMDDELYIMGSGSTTAFIMDELGETNTLLGVDVLQDHAVIANDVTEPQLWSLIENHLSETQSADNISHTEAIKLVITLIGGQGHIFGRGNQQLSPRVIKAIGKDNIIIVATKTKLAGLNSRPLIIDTGDTELDQALSGYFPVITGYKDQVLYPASSPL